MVSHIRRCTVFVIVAASGILSATFVASAAPQAEQRNSLASPAVPQGAVATTGSGIPTVAGFYRLPNGDVRDLRVSFVQNADGDRQLDASKRQDLWPRNVSMGSSRWLFQG